MSATLPVLPVPETLKIDPDVGAIIGTRLDNGEIIRRVLDRKLGASLDAALATVPDSKRAVVIAHANLRGDLTLSAVMKVSDRWSFAGVLAVKPGQRVEGEAVVRFTT